MFLYDGACNPPVLLSEALIETLMFAITFKDEDENSLSVPKRM